MEELIQLFDFPDLIEGNSSVQVLFKLPEMEIYNLSGAKIFMQLRKRPGQIVAAEFSTVNGKLQLVTDYWFLFPSQVINVPADNYSYDILFIFPSGLRRSYVGGKFPIKPINTKKKI